MVSALTVSSKVKISTSSVRLKVNETSFGFVVSSVNNETGKGVRMSSTLLSEVSLIANRVMSRLEVSLEIASSLSRLISFKSSSLISITITGQYGLSE